MEKELIEKLNILEQKLKFQQRVFGITIFMAIFVVIGYGFTHNNSFNIIKAKGIIIQDSLGKDRILIGAPIPFSKDRVRTDTALLRKYWGTAYEEQINQYMEWYKNYKNDANGIVVLNENGFDRVQLGDQLSDPNIGKRQFEMAGLVWNDKQGWERGGLGVNTTSNGSSRSVMGVDNEHGEAVHIVALENGTKGIIINDESGRLLVGMSPANGKFFKNKQKFTGIKYFDNKGNLVWEQPMDSATKK